jgi:hypothetical protein
MFIGPITSTLSSTNQSRAMQYGGFMKDLIAPLITLAVMALFVAAWLFYLRRVRQGRADPVVDPSWPSNLKPMPRSLYDPASQDPEHSLFIDTHEPGPGRREPDSA